MLVPALFLLEVSVVTVCCSESNTPREDSTMYSMATATNRMMNATTEAMKLNFMTDHGSSRASVSIACRFAGRRVFGSCFLLRFCQADVTELAYPAIPAAAPLIAAAAPEENPAALPGVSPLGLAIVGVYGGTWVVGGGEGGE